MSIFEPLKVGDQEVANRIWLSPMTRGRADEDFVPTPHMADYYSQRASMGLVLTEASAVNVTGASWMHHGAIFNSKQAAGWKNVVDAVHAKGGKIGIQLWHMGRQAHSSIIGGDIVAPSAIAMPGEVSTRDGSKVPGETPKPLTVDEIKATVKDFADAAERAINESGFDFVQVHGANGYLVDTFLQSVSNNRDDEYGGSVTNRLKFMQEIISAILERVPGSKVSIRLSPNGSYGGMGSADNNEQFSAAIKWLGDQKLAFIEVLDGLGFGFHEKSEPYTLKMAREILDTTGGAGYTKLVGNVGYNQETAEAAVSSGVADAICIGRPAISNPDLVERYKNGWPLAADAPYPTWWGTTTAEGYSDWPTYSPK